MAPGINLQGIGQLGWPMVAALIFVGTLITLGVSFVYGAVSRIFGFVLIGIGSYMVWRGRGRKWAFAVIAIGGLLAITNFGHEFMLDLYRDLGVLNVEVI